MFSAVARANGPILVRSGSLPAGQPYSQYQLSNGLQIYVIENHSAPVVSYQTVFRVGSREEKLDPAIQKTGLAHLFEHLMFRGTPLHPDGTFDQILSETGAVNENATTWTDRTNFYESVPSSALETTMSLEADRMANLSITSSVFSKEQTTVLSELNAGLDDPNTVAYELLYQNAFTVHPYGSSVIGSASDIQSFTLAQSNSFYKKYYSPSNATLLVIGDVNSQNVANLAQQYYGAIPAETAPVAVAPVEPAQTQEKIVSDFTHPQLMQPRLVLGYHGPSLRDPDFAPMWVAESILASGESSVLQSIWVDTGRAVSVHGNLDTFQDPGLLTVSADIQSSYSASDLVGPLDQALSTLAQSVSPADVTRAQNLLLLSIYQQWENNSSLGEYLSEFIKSGDATANDPLYGVSLVQAIQNVTAQDVSRVIGKYLVASNRVRLVGRPENINSTSAPHPIQKKDYSPAENRELPKTLDPISSGTAPVVPMTMNGLNILNEQNPQSQLVHLKWVIRSGNLSDGNLSGLSHFTARALLRGTLTRPHSELTNAIESLGAKINVISASDHTVFDIAVLANNLDPFLSILNDIFTEPAFDVTEMSSLHGILQGELKSAYEEPESLAALAVRRQLYTGSAYQNSPLGSVDSLVKITSHDLGAFFSTHYVYQNMLVGVAGPMSTADVTALINAKMSSLLSGAPDTSSYPSAKITGQNAYVVNASEVSTNSVFVVVPGVGENDPDRLALEVGNFTFGGDFTSTLMQQLRVQNGWTYGVYSGFNQVLNADGGEGLFSIYLFPSSEFSALAIPKALTLFQEYVKNGIPTDDAFNFAKIALQNRYVFKLETAEDRINGRLTEILTGRPFLSADQYNQSLNSLTRAGVNVAIQSHLQYGNMAIIAVGDSSALSNIFSSATPPISTTVINVQP